MIVVSRRLRRWRAALVTLLGAASLSNCRLDDLLSPGEFGTLAVVPIELHDSARVGSLATRTTTADLQIDGPGTRLDFAVMAEGASPWLALSSPTGSAPGTLSMTLNPAGLAVGEYRDTLRFTSEGPEKAPVRVAVLFRVLPCEVLPLAAVPATENDALTAADCVSALHPDRYAKRFAFTGTAGDSVTINLTSAAFGASVSLWADGGATPLAESANCEASGTGACVRYILLPETGSYGIEVTSDAARSVGAFTLTLGRPRAPAEPTALGQRTADGAATPIAVGATHGAATLSLRATLTDPDLDSLRMEVEVRPTGTAFTGVATGTSVLTRGPDLSVDVAGLNDNTSYHWQARAVDVTGRASAWVAFGGNAAGATDFAVSVPDAPAAPTALVQRRSDGVTAIAAGGTTDESVVRLGATMSDPDPGDQVRLEVELRPLGSAFTGVASASSALVASGSSVLVTVAGLSDNVQYRWQARTVDAAGAASAWVAFSLSGADLRTALPPAQLAVTVQPVATAAGAVITPAVRIAVQDGSGATLTSFAGDVSIAIGANPGGATLGGTTTVAAVNGVAMFADLAIVQVGAGYTLVASAGALTVTTVAFDVTSSAAQALEVGAVPATVTAGETITPAVTVTVRDGFGNVAAGFNDAVTLALSPNGAGATLLGTTTVNAVGGVATFSDLRVERAGTGFTLLASASGVPNGTGSAFGVTAAAGAALRIATPPSASAMSGAPLAVQPAIAIEDAFGNPVPVSGTSMTATIASGSGGSLANASATTDANGIATFGALALTGPVGAYTLSFTSDAFPALPAVTSGPITLGVGAATQLAIVVPPSATAQNGVVFAQQPQVQLRDAAGSDVATGGVSVSVSVVIATGGGVLSGTSTVLTSAAGTAIFTDLAITGLVGTRTLSFSAPSLTGVTSGGIQLTAGAATQLTLQAGDGQSATAGSAVAIAPSVVARDMSDNPVAGVPVTFGVASGGGSIAPTGTVTTGVDGIAALTSWTLGGTAGGNTVVAASDGLEGSPVTFTATATAGAASLLTISGGQDLSGPVATLLGTPHEVRVTDASGNPVAGVTVNWAAIGGGSVDPASGVTDTDGRATTARTLGPTAGAQSTEATVTLSGGAATVTFNLTATVGGATQMTLLAGDAQADTVGATLATPLAVVVRDALNNPVEGVLISWSVIDGGGSVLPTTSLTDASGIATTSWTLGTVTTPTDSTQLARASGVGTPVIFTATSRPATVSATQTLVSVAPASIAASRATPATVTVTARDRFNNPIPNQAVTLAATGDGNTIVQPAAPTGATGVTTGAIGATVTGARTIIATVDGIVATQQPTLTVVAAPATQLIFMVPPADVVAGTSFTATPSVGALDSLGNQSLVYGGMVTLAIGTNPASGVLGGTLTRNAVSGVAAFPGLSIDRAAAGFTLTASATGLTGVTSEPFAVTAGGVAVARSSIAAVPGTITAGGPAATITVTARDVNDNPVAGATVVLAATGTGNTLTQPALVTDANGEATGTLASTDAGMKLVSATIGGATVPTTTSVVVTPAAVSATLSGIAALPTSIVAGGSGSVITVTARDAFGNVIPGATVSIGASGDGITVTQPVAVTNASGIATGEVASTATGTKVVSATVNGLLLTPTADLTVTAAAVSAITSTVSAAPGAISADGATSTITVTARDAFGNVVPGATVVLAASGSGNAITQPAAVTDANGVTTGAIASTVAGAKTVSTTIAGIAITQTANITVTPGVVSASQSTVIATPPTIVATGGTSTITVTARDVNGNVIPGATVVLLASGTDNTLTQPDAVTDENGVATGTISSTVAGVKVVSASIAGVTVAQTATVTVSAGAASAALSTISAAPGAIVAGVGTSTVTVTARDASNNPIAGAAVVLSATGAGNDITQPAVTDADGVATGTFASTVAEAKVISAAIEGVTINQTAAVTVTPGAVSAATSTVAVTPGSIVAGTPTSTITVTARDANGNVVPGLAVVLAATGGGNTVTQPVAVTDAAGVATGTIASTVAESKTVSATIDGVAVTQTAGVTVVPAAVSAAQSAVQVSSATISAAIGSATVTVTVRDAFGNAIGGAEVAFAATGTGNTLAPTSVSTAANGIATSIFSSTVSEAKVISATADGVAITQTAAVNVVPDAPSGAQSSLFAAPGTITAGGAGSTITVTVRDATGNPVQGVTVAISATGTGNSITAPATTDADGVTTATFTSTGAGAKTISATASGVAIVQTASVTVQPAAVSAATSTVEASAATITAGGAGSTITVTARDAFGNLLEGAAITLASTGSANSFGAASGATNASGVFSTEFTSTAAEPKTISATINAVAITQTAAVTVVPGAVSAGQTTVQVAPATIIAGGAASTITVTARDANDNPISGLTVVLDATGGENTLTQPITVTDANGVATGSLGSTVAEAKLVSATVGGVAITQTPVVTVGPGAVSAAQSTVSAAPGTITAGGAGSTITVTARDANGNPIAGATVVLASSGTGNTLVQPLVATDANGVATGSISSTVAAAKVISATIDGNDVTQTAAITVVPGAVSPAQSTVTADPTTLAAGSGTSTITVTARDASGNAITGATVVLAASGTGNALTQPGVATDANGVATGSLGSTVVEVKAISATIDGVPVSQTAIVTVTPGAVSAAQTTVEAAPASITTDGSGSTITVTARDASGNPIPGLVVTLAATGAGNVLTQPAAVTDANGMATGTLTSTVVESKTVSATVDAVAVAQTVSVTVVPGAVSAALSTISASPTTIVAGGSGSFITVTARDAFGNVIPGATVAIGASGDGIMVTEPVEVTDANGVATGEIASTATGTKVVSATVNGLALTSTVNLTVNAGAVSATLSSVAADPQVIVAGGQTSTVTVIARDANGNRIAGAMVALVASGVGNAIVQPGVTDANGVATGTFESDSAGIKTVSATIAGVAVTQAATIEVAPGALSVTESEMEAVPASIIAGAESSTITVTARDAIGNPIPGATVVLAATGTGNVLAQPAAVTNANGQASGTLTSTVAEVKTVTATIDGVSIDASAVVTVTVGGISAVQSTVVAAPGSISADGGSSTITVTARDGNGNPIAGLAVTLASTGTANTFVQPVGVTGANGVITGTIASTVAEVKTVSATIGGVTATQTAPVTVTAGAVTAGNSSVSASPASISADGGTSTITVTARDQNSNLVPGATVVIAATGGGNTLGQPGGVTNALGVATGTLTSTLAEVKTVSATANGVAVAQTAGVTVVAGAVSLSVSTVEALPTTITAGGAGSTITVTARDANGNPVAGRAVTLIGDGTSITMPQPGAVTDANGVATSTLTSPATGTKTVTALIDLQQVQQTAQVTVTASALSPLLSTISASPTAITTDGVTTTITVTARDVSNNPIPGLPVTLAATGTGNVLTQPAAVTDANGVATGTLASTVAATKTVSATIDGEGIVATTTVTVNPGAVSAAQSLVAVAPASITTDDATSTVTITVRDANNNPISGVAVTLAATGSGNAITQPAGTTNATGVITGTIASTVVGAKVITATAGGVELNQEPTVTVTPGAVSLVQSSVNVGSGTVVSGATTTVTLTARDAAGNPLAAGGLTVAFTLGAGTSAGTFSNLTDNANGTYTATFTATTAGTARGIGATIGGNAVTSAAPTIIVTPGAVNLAQSAVTVGGPTVVSGAMTTVTLTARDAAGNQLPAGGLTVLFTLGAGTSAGTFSTVTDIGNGTYTATFIATTAGTARSIGATIGGNAVTSAAPTITVTPGAVNLAQSAVTVGSATVASGTQTTLTLTARDAAGNLLASGGLAVAFILGDGTSDGTVGTVADNGNGTYTATFTATTVGTARNIGATIGGNAVTSAAPTITVTPGAVSLLQSTVAVGDADLVSGEATTVTLTARDAAGNQLPAGGLAVAFTLGAGTSAGTFTNLTDNGNGTYTATFTATTAGTAQSIGATIGGNAVTSAAPTITVTPGAASVATSTITAAPTAMTTDGSSTITVQLRDAANNLVGASGGTVALATNLGSLTAVTNNGNGTYTATLTATAPGTATITGTLNAVALTDNATVAVSVGAVSLAQSSVSVGSGTVVSGATTTVTLTARDAAGNQLPAGGLAVAFTLGAGTSAGTFTNLTDNGNGTYTATFTATTAGTARSIGATIGGNAVTSVAPTITVTPGAVSAATSSVVLAPTSITTDGQTSTVTITARDANNNPVSGATVTFVASGNGNSLTQPAAVTNAAGVTTGTISSTIVGTKTITATAGGVELDQEPDLAVTVGVVNAATSTVGVSPGSIVAGNATSTITITARDAGGNPIAGATASFVASGDANTLVQPAGVTDANGVTTGTIASETAEVKTITVTINGVQVTPQPTVTVTPDVAVSLGFFVHPVDGEVSVALDPFVVRALDQFGNVATDFTGDVTIAIAPNTGEPGAGLTGTLTVAAVAGSATFNAVAVNLAGTDFQLVATSLGLAAAAPSFAFAVAEEPPQLVTAASSRRHPSGVSLPNALITGGGLQ